MPETVLTVVRYVVARHETILANLVVAPVVLDPARARITNTEIVPRQRRSRAPLVSTISLAFATI